MSKNTDKTKQTERGSDRATATCSASEALAILKAGFERGVHGYDIDAFYIDNDVEISWDVIEMALLGEESIVSKKDSLKFLKSTFECCDDPFWEIVVESVMGELDENLDGADLVCWDHIMVHF